MTRIQYTTEQIDILSNNIYIKSITDKYITFTNKMKIKSLNLDSKGMYFKDIFKYLGFPDFIINSNIPKQSLKNWRNKVKTKGFIGLSDIKKGRKEKDKVDFDNLDKDREIEYLKAKVAYLEEIAKLKINGFP